MASTFVLWFDLVLRRYGWLKRRFGISVLRLVISPALFMSNKNSLYAMIGIVSAHETPIKPRQGLCLRGTNRTRSWFPQDGQNNLCVLRAIRSPPLRDPLVVGLLVAGSCLLACYSALVGLWKLESIAWKCARWRSGPDQITNTCNSKWTFPTDDSCAAGVSQCKCKLQL